MKRILIHIVFTVLVLVAIKGFGQTTITGHVFAEVVESVSASSQSQASFTIQRNQTDRIDFGQIEIKSAASASCSLILGKANLTGNNQQSATLATTAYSTQGMQGNAINGYQSISLQCQANESMLAQEASQYHGEVNIVLAYN